MSLERWRISGSKPPSARQARASRSSNAVPERANAQRSPASWASGATSGSAAHSGMRRRQDEQQRVAAELGDLERRVARARRVVVLLRDDEVDLPAPQQVEALLRLHLPQLQPQPRVRLGQRAEQREDQARGGGLERRHPRTARDLAARRGAELGLGQLQPRDHGVGVVDQPRGSASVSCRPRPRRSSSGTPASRSSVAGCWETADGV